MKRLNIILGIVAGSLVLAVSAGAEQSFTDPAGDGGSSADVTGVTIGNDGSGLITFRVTAAAPITPDQGFIILIDADKNPATGFLGAEFFVSDIFFGYVTNGALNFDFTPPPSLRASVSGNVAEIAINRVDLGDTGGFGFKIDSLGEGDIDTAPDAGWYTYDLVYPQCSNAKDDDGDGKIDTADLGCSSATDEDESDDPVTIRLGQAKTTPPVPKAGRTALVSAATTRVETGQPLDDGTVTCTARIVGAKALKGTGSLVAGKAQCKLKLPADAKKKTVRGQIKVVYETAIAKASFSFRTAAA